MAYSYTAKPRQPDGGGYMKVFGTFTDAAAAGSEIVTGFSYLATYGATSDEGNILCSASGGTLTVKAENDGTDDGVWFAIGR